MKCRRIAVLGGSGKIGRRIVAFLIEHGFTVRVLEHRTPVPGQVNERIRGSIADPKVVEEVVTGADIVVQLATTKEAEDSFFNVTMRGTLNVLEACREQEIQQFLLLSGDAAMGIWFYPQPIPIDENHPHTAYPGYYAFTKVMEEVMAQQYAIQYGLPVTILRSSWVFENDDLLNHLSLLRNVNPSEPGHGLAQVTEEVKALVDAGAERIPILTCETGLPLRRHIVHIDDVIQAFGRMLANPVAIGQSFNIAAPAAFSYDVAAQYASQCLGIPTIRLICPEYHSFEINISRARSMLGYAPQNDILHMIDRAISYRQERREL